MGSRNNNSRIEFPCQSGRGPWFSGHKYCASVSEEFCSEPNLMFKPKSKRDVRKVEADSRYHCQSLCQVHRKCWHWSYHENGHVSAFLAVFERL